MSIKSRKGKFARDTARSHMPIPLLVLVDVLLAGTILLTFAFFHHVLPAAISQYQFQQSLLDATEPSATEESVTEESVTELAQETMTETQEATEPDDRTPWQIKFEDKFTDEVVITENSYSSPEVSITLETISVGEGGSRITYHVADIYVASVDNFVTHTPNGEMRYYVRQDVMELNEECDAILSISGDFSCLHMTGFIMRNGVIYSQLNSYSSICVLFQDGTMATYEAKTYEIDELIQKGAVQVWSFGPVLLDENGKAKANFPDLSMGVEDVNPRSAVGYYEPGHYCFVVVDGRDWGYSVGIEIPELAQIFEELGCTAAYNLDGGGSAVMVFNHEKYSVQSNGGRDLGDILVIRDSYHTAPEEEEVAQ